MRLPGRFLAFACGFLTVAASVAQAPPPPPPVREVPGGTLVVTPETQKLTESRGVSIAQAPQPLGFESDLNCFGYVGQPRDSFSAAIIGAENIAEQTDFTMSDLLYVNAGYDRGFKVGDEFWIFTFALAAGPSASPSLGVTVHCQV